MCIRMMLLILDSQSIISYYEKHKEHVRFQTMVVGIPVLVLTTNNKALIIDRYLFTEYDAVYFISVAS